LVSNDSRGAIDEQKSPVEEGSSIRPRFQRSWRAGAKDRQGKIHEKAPKGGSGGRAFCPIITAHTGSPTKCIEGVCKMWVQELQYYKDGDCGFRLISMYAGFEIERMTRPSMGVT